MRGLRCFLSWRFLLVLLPVAWLTGAAFARAPELVGNVLTWPADHEGLGIVLFLLGWVVSAGIVGLILAGIARALGPETIRTLCSEQQAWRFGALSTALLWIALIGIYWADYTHNEIALYVWQVITGVAGDFFALIWLVIGVRAAASTEAMRIAVTFASGAVSSFLGGIGLAVILYTFMGIMPPGVVIAMVSFLVMMVLVLPPALLTAGMAALFAGLPQAVNQQRRDEPPGMPPV